MLEQIRDFFTLPSSDVYNKTKFLTGFRGYAALGVMLIHSGGAGLASLGEAGVKVVDFGKYGVVVFFVLSAFTIVNSIDSGKKFKFSNYLYRRFFRIVPLYVVTLAAAVFIVDQATLSLDKVGNFVAASSFISLLDLGSRNNILSVEWTIPIEVFFYLILPSVWFYLAKKPHIQKILNVLLIGLVLTLITYKFTILPYYNYSDHALALFYSVERYAFTYACGICAYFFLQRVQNLQISSGTLGGVLLIFFIYIILGERGFGDLIFVTLWSTLLIIVCYGKSWLSRLIFENPFIIYLGTISYSFYLTHVVVLSFVPPTFNRPGFFLVGLSGTIVVSSLTYFFIEKPFIKLSKSIVSK